MNIKGLMYELSFWTLLYYWIVANMLAALHQIHVMQLSFGHILFSSVVGLVCGISVTDSTDFGPMA